MKMNKTNYAELKSIAKKIRVNLINLHHNSNASHIGSGLSIVDILTTLYFKTCNIGKENIENANRDKIILSKGHAAASLYAVLKEKGILSEKELSNYYKNNQILGGHPSLGIKGIEASSGSLGHGFPIAVGMALANKLDKNKNEVFAVLGDGECNEGSIFESAIIAVRFCLENLTIIVDCNELQGYDCTKDICPPERLIDMWKSTGAYVIEINGHNFKELDAALDKKNKQKNKPKVIIARTIKGEGISFMENKLEWHYKSPNDEQKEKALKEIEEKRIR